MKRSLRHAVDELLVLQAQDGDQQAVALLIERYQPRLRNLARRMTGSADAVGDVTQEAWLAIARGLSRLEDPARFRPWAMRILANKATDWVRRRVQDRSRSAEAIAGRESTTDTPDDPTSRVRDAMDRLTPEHRAVVALHYQEDLPVAVIAETLGVPRGTVKSRLHHAREQLRNELTSGKDER